jgi:hypothetical protein
MSRGPARITQAQVARVIRAAKQAGAAAVEVKPDGTVLVLLSPETTEHTGNGVTAIADGERIVL